MNLKLLFMIDNKYNLYHVNADKKIFITKIEGMVK